MQQCKKMVFIQRPWPSTIPVYLPFLSAILENVFALEVAPYVASTLFWPNFNQDSNSTETALIKVINEGNYKVIRWPSGLSTGPVNHQAGFDSRLGDYIFCCVFLLF